MGNYGGCMRGPTSVGYANYVSRLLAVNLPKRSGTGSRLRSRLSRSVGVAMIVVGPMPVQDDGPPPPPPRIQSFLDAILLVVPSEGLKPAERVGNVYQEGPAPTAPLPPPQLGFPDLPGTPTDAQWDRMAQCESGGNWSINTGNGFYGGLQFTRTSWRSVGGSGTANQASRDEQIYRADKLWLIQGWGAWPACSRKLGYR